LRRLLLLQQIPQGERLTEADWAERLQVNRMALREAFARLQAEGFIEDGQKGGYFVPKLTREDILDILSVRAVIETAAIDRICESGFNTPDRLKSLTEACDLHESLAQGDYHFAVVEVDHGFHQELVRASGSKRLLLAYRHAPLPIILPAITAGEQWVARVRRTIEEHRAILKAIFGGEVDQAKELLRLHLTPGRPLGT